MLKIMLVTEIEVLNPGLSEGDLKQVVKHVLNKYFQFKSNKWCLPNSNSVVLDFEVRHRPRTSTIRFVITISNNVVNNVEELPEVCCKAFSKLKEVLNELLADEDRDVPIVVIFPNTALVTSTKIKSLRKLMPNIYEVRNEEELKILVNEYVRYLKTRSV